MKPAGYQPYVIYLFLLINLIKLNCIYTWVKLHNNCQHMIHTTYLVSYKRLKKWSVSSTNVKICGIWTFHTKLPELVVWRKVCKKDKKPEILLIRDCHGKALPLSSCSTYIKITWGITSNLCIFLISFIIIWSDTLNSSIKLWRILQ